MTEHRLHSSAWHPTRWTPTVYFWILGSLAAVNLFGPKGLLHWLLLRQERTRLERRAQELNVELASIEKEMAHFSGSRSARERAIRAKLGYLKNDEFSIEILDHGHDP
jgi:hypothetical protein